MGIGRAKHEQHPIFYSYWDICCRCVLPWILYGEEKQVSILIDDMKMPKSPVLFCIHPDGKVFADLEGGWREYKAVPVPPHGRLGDLDELKMKIKKRRASDGT